MRITAQGYRDIIDQSEWPEDIRNELEWRCARAKALEAQLATMDEKSIRDRKAFKRLQAALRDLQLLHSALLQQAGWESRPVQPFRAVESRNRLNQKRGRMQVRLARARREALSGEAIQSAWLSDNAELIQAFERYCD